MDPLGITGGCTRALRVRRHQPGRRRAAPLSTSATIVYSGQGFTLSAQFAALGSGQTVSFQRKNAADLDWVTVATVNAKGSGLASTLYVPAYTAQYRTTFAGGGGLSAGTSDVVSVSARFNSAVMTPNYTGTRASTRARWSRTRRPPARSTPPISPPPSRSGLQLIDGVSGLPDERDRSVDRARRCGRSRGRGTTPARGTFGPESMRPRTTRLCGRTSPR